MNNIAKYAEQLINADYTDIPKVYFFTKKLANIFGSPAKAEEIKRNYADVIPILRELLTTLKSLQANINEGDETLFIYNLNKLKTDLLPKLAPQTQSTPPQIAAPTIPEPKKVTPASGPKKIEFTGFVMTDEFRNQFRNLLQKTSLSSDLINKVFEKWPQTLTLMQEALFNGEDIYKNPNFDGRRLGEYETIVTSAPFAIPDSTTTIQVVASLIDMSERDVNPRNTRSLKRVYKINVVKTAAALRSLIKQALQEEVGLSNIMRGLKSDKKKALSFLKAFKQNFDKAYIAGAEDPSIEAISSTTKEFDIKVEDFYDS